jgi:AcrR family transcriptional regulator
MFTKNVKDADKRVKPRGRGRPRGETPQGAAARLALYKTAIDLIGERGYEATTLREVADRAGVSVGLLYRYFPSKRAVVLALYDELSAEYAARAAEMKEGKWRDRFIFALTTSLRVLAPHRGTLAALVPVLVGDASEGLFAPATAFSRQRVQRVFLEAVVGASDAPRPEVTPALARLLYLAHLAIIFWWLLDKSPHQRATTALVALSRRALPPAALTLRLPQARAFVIAGDKLFREALFEDADGS